jgi:hypothetical protein
MSFTTLIEGCLDVDCTEGLGLHVSGVLLCIITYRSWSSANGIATGSYNLRRQVKWRWSFPVQQTSISRRFGHYSFGGFNNVIRRHTPMSFVFLLGFLLLIEICGSPGYLLLNGEMM